MTTIDARVAALSPEKRALLARRVAVHRLGDGPRSLPRRPGVNTFRMSLAQERLWFLEQVAPGNVAFNVVGAFLANGRLDLVALQRSFAELVARHESLRTTFATVDGVPFQVVSPLVPVRVRTVASDAAGAKGGSAAQGAVVGELETPFDLAHGPLVRMTVHPIQRERALIGVALHHLIADAWSVAVVVREVCALYRAAIEGRPVDLRRPALHYADYAEWQRAPEREARWRIAADYWRLQLADAPYPAAPIGARLRFRGAAHRIDLPAALAAALSSCARREGTTLFVVVLTAWLVALGERAGLDDVTVLSPVANRERPEVADVIGFFVNLVALRVRIDGTESVRALFARVHETVRAALQHQALPFEAVLGELGVTRTLGRPPLSPFGFAIERSYVDAIDLPGVTIARHPLPTTTNRTDLMLVVEDEEERLSARLEYDSEHYDPADVSRLLTAFVAGLERVVDDPSRRCASLHALPSEVRGTRRTHEEIEHILADVWREVLGVDACSPDDNFFALGGDSLSSIRVVARARRHGLVLHPQQLFEYQTVAALARVVVDGTEVPEEQGLVVGPVPLTPIQAMLLEADLPDLDHFNMATMLWLPERPDPTLLAVAVEHLLRQHDALRLRLTRDRDGWRQTIVGLDGPVPFVHVDLTSVDDASVAATVAARAGSEQVRLNLAEGPIIRVVFFDLGTHRPSRLLVIVHHLACDAVSWPILLEDLTTVYDQLQRGVGITLPPKSSSFRRWAELVTVWGRDPKRTEERGFWERECGEPGARIPRRRSGASAIADVERLESAVDEEGSGSLLACVARERLSVESACLGALAMAIVDAVGDTGLLVYLERHGRDVLPALDLTRTVGWFTAVFPVRVPVDPARRPAETLRLVEAHLRAVPHGGAGYGIVRHGLAATYRPEVSFNYLGRTDPAPGARWRLASEPVGAEHGARGTRPTVLDVTARFANGRLRFTWDYDRTIVERPFLESLAARTETLLRALALDTPVTRT